MGSLSNSTAINQSFPHLSVPVYQTYIMFDSPFMESGVLTGFEFIAAAVGNITLLVSLNIQQEQLLSHVMYTKDIKAVFY